MTVSMLITADKEEHLPQILLCQNTIRVGFPNARIMVYDNGSRQKQAVLTFAEKIGATYTVAAPFFWNRVHHAEWLETVLLSRVQKEEPHVVVDSDTLWWENVENLEIPGVWGGAYQPGGWSEWANCPGISRLHTSFLFVPSPSALIRACDKAKPFQMAPPIGYRDAQLWFPQIIYYEGMPLFHDTAAAAYHAIGGYCFEEDIMNKYDHLNSASFKDYMKFEKQEGFNYLHEIAAKNPRLLKGMWKEILAYWAEMYTRTTPPKLLQEAQAKRFTQPQYWIGKVNELPT